MVSDPALVARLESYPKTMRYEAKDTTGVVYLVGIDLHRAAARIKELEREVLRLSQPKDAAQLAWD